MFCKALYEHVVYYEKGQILSGLFLNYVTQHTGHFPPLDIHMHNTHCKNNILGIRGLGEAGAIGAPQTVLGAVYDALGVDHGDMLAKPKKIWYFA